MARVKSFIEYYEAANTTTTTPPLPEHVSGDLLLVFASKDDVTGGDSTTASSGWTVGGAGDSPGSTTAGCNGSWFYKVATTSDESITITNSDADTWSVLSICIEGAHTTSPIDASDGNGQQETASQAAVLEAASINTNFDNSLVFYAAAVSAGTFSPFPGVRTVSAFDNAVDGVCVGMKVQASAGSTGTCRFYAENHTTANARTFTVAIRDSGTLDYLPAYLNTDHAELISPLRGITTSLRGETWATAVTNIPVLGQVSNKAVYQYDDSTTTFYDVTTAANNATVSDWQLLNNSPVPAANDYTAFCMDQPFIGFRVLYTTAASGGTRVWEYYNGTTWVTLTTTDATTSFSAVAGTVYNISMTVAQLRSILRWKPTTLNGTTGYWLRCRWSTAPSTNPTMTYMRPMYGYTLYDAVAALADAGALPYHNAASFTPAVAVQGEWGGTYLTLGTDVTPITPANKLIVGTWQYNQPRDYIDTSRRSELGGIAINFMDASFNERTYIIGAFKAADTSQDDRNMFVIQWSSTNKTYPTPLTNTDPTTISHVGVWAHQLRGAGSQQFNQLVAVTAPIVNGGTTANPITSAEFYDTFNMEYYYPIPYYRGGLMSIPVQFGGGDELNMHLDLAQIKFPRLTTEPDAFSTPAYCSYHLDEAVLGLIFDARAGDTCKFTNSVVSGDSRWRFEFLGTASASATWDFSGTTIINAVVTLRDVTTFSNMNFVQCGQITTNDADVTGSIISNSTETDGAILFPSTTAGNAVTSIEFTDNNDGDLGHSIRITATGTYTFDGHTFSGGGTVDAIAFHTQTDVDATDNEIDITGHGYATGDAVYYQDQTGSDTIGLTDGNLYYVRAVTANAISFFSTKADAIANTNEIDLNDGSAGQTHYLYSAKADVYNASGGAITINVTNGGTTPTIRNSNGSSTTVNNTVTLEVNGVKSGEEEITHGAITGGDSAFAVGNYLRGVTSSAVGTIRQVVDSTHTVVGEITGTFNATEAVRETTTGDAGGDTGDQATASAKTTRYVSCRIEARSGGDLSEGTQIMNEEANQGPDGDGNYSATESFNFTNNQPVLVKARYRGYLPFQTTGIITAAGLTITAVWLVDSNYSE